MNIKRAAVAARVNRVFAAAAVLLPLVFGIGCTSEGTMNPGMSGIISTATGGRVGSREMQAAGGVAKLGSAAFMGDAEARTVGESISLALVQASGLTADQNLAQYVTKVGLTVAAVSPRPELTFTFGVLNTDEVNAYSTPGGYVFVTRGLISKMQDESELAGILAHEVGHICRDHGLKAIKGATAASAFSDLASAGTASSAASAAMPMVDSGIDLFSKGFSQADESEADAEAVKYLKAAGYDANGLARIVERISQASTSSNKMFSMPTHPPTAQRVSKMKSLAGSTPGAKNWERFASNVKR